MHKGHVLMPLFLLFSHPKKIHWVFETCRFYEGERKQYFVECENTLDQHVYSNKTGYVNLYAISCKNG
jgi:hypothetical protein